MRLLKRFLLLGLVCALLVAVFPNTPARIVAAQEPVANEMVGDVEVMAAQDSHLYVRVGTKLAIVDVSNPLEQRQISTLSLPAAPTDIAIVGRVAYVVCPSCGLQVFDLSNPNTPTPLGSLDLPGVKVRVSETWAYVLSAQGLHVVDVTNPRQPVQVAVHDEWQAPAYDALEMLNTHVVLWRGDSLQILRFLSPQGTPSVGNYRLAAGQIYDVSSYDVYLYLATSGGLQIVNASNPAAPTQITSYAEKLGPDAQIAVKLNRAVSVPTFPPSADPPGGAISGERIIYHMGIFLYADHHFATFSYSINSSTEISDNWKSARLSIAPLADAETYSFAVLADHAYLAQFNQGLTTLGINERAIVQFHRFGVPTPGAEQRPTTMHRLDMVNHVGGAVRVLAAQGNYLYMQIGVQFAIVDVSNPAQMRRVGYMIVPEPITSAVVVGSYAYLSCEICGLQVFDLTNPAAPQLIRTLAGRVSRMQQVDNFLYVGNVQGVVVFDLANPREPVPIATYSDLWGWAEVTSQRLIALGSRFFSIYDARNPRAIRLIGTYNLNTPGIDIEALTFQGGYVYLVTSNDLQLSVDLQVIDIRKPAAPKLMKSLPLTLLQDYPQLEVNGQYLYLVTEQKLFTFDIRQPGNPIQTSVVPFNNSIPSTLNNHHFVVLGNHVYVSDTWRGVHVFSLANPAAPALVAFENYAAPEAAYYLDIEQYQQYIYTDGTIFDASDPAQLKVVGAYTGTLMAIDAEYAYITDNQYGLGIWSLSDPIKPVLLSTYNYGWSAGSLSRIKVQYPLLYLSFSPKCSKSGSCWGGGFHVLNIADRTKPQQVSFSDKTMYRFNAYQNYVYGIGISGWQPKIWDFTNPTAPVEYPGVVDASKIYSAYPRLYSAVYTDPLTSSGESLLYIYDIRTPLQPSMLTTIPLGKRKVAWIAEPYIYLLNLYELTVLDLTDIYQPRFVASYELPRYVPERSVLHPVFEYRMISVGDTLYVVGRGMFVIKLRTIPITHRVHLPYVARLASD